EERSDAHQGEQPCLCRGRIPGHRLLTTVESACEKWFLAGRRHRHRLQANLKRKRRSGIR
ncbi:hypothetical protein PMAYCL1PPCAC_14076, partial [Pristionchus mayeri]